MKYVLVLLLVWGAWLYFRPRPRRPEEQALTEARAVLRVGLRADQDAIRAAHRRLVADAHPDRGGSTELTRRLNDARDLLLKDARH